MLVLGLAVREARGVTVDHEPGRPAGRQRQHRAGIGDAAVGDPLLAAVDPVADDRAVLEPGVGGRLQRAEVAAGLGLGGAVGQQEALLGDPAEPELLLLVGAADQDRVAAEEGGEHAGGDAEVDRGHPLADAVDVERAAAHPAVLLGDEQQLDAELLAAHAAHELLRELVALVELDQQLVGELALGELVDRLERERQFLWGEPSGGGHRGHGFSTSPAALPSPARLLPSVGCPPTAIAARGLCPWSWRRNIRCSPQVPPLRRV